MEKIVQLPKMIPVSAVAPFLGCSTKTVYQMLHENHFPEGVAVRLGGRRIRFNEDRLMCDNYFYRRRQLELPISIRTDVRTEFLNLN